MNLLWHIEVVIIILIIIGLTKRQICRRSCSLSQHLNIAIELFFEIIKSLIYEISGLTVFLFPSMQLRYLLLPYSI